MLPMFLAAWAACSTQEIKKNFKSHMHDIHWMQQSIEEKTSIKLHCKILLFFLLQVSISLMDPCSASCHFFSSAQIEAVSWMFIAISLTHVGQSNQLLQPWGTCALLHSELQCSNCLDTSDKQRLIQNHLQETVAVFRHHHWCHTSRFPCMHASCSSVRFVWADVCCDVLLAPFSCNSLCQTQAWSSSIKLNLNLGMQKILMSLKLATHFEEESHAELFIHSPASMAPKIALIPSRKRKMPIVKNQPQTQLNTVFDESMSCLEVFQIKHTQQWWHLHAQVLCCSF